MNTNRPRRRTYARRARTSALSITAKPVDQAQHVTHKGPLRKDRADVTVHVGQERRQREDEMRSRGRTPLPPMPLSELPALKALLDSALPSAGETVTSTARGRTRAVR